MDFKSAHQEYQKLVEKLKLLRDQHRSVSSLNFLKKMLLKSKLEDTEKHLKRIKKELFKELDHHLKSQMPAFHDTLKENIFLLTKSDFTMQVHTVGSDMVSSTELKFTGAISPKGYLYLDVKKTDFMTSMIRQGMMSRSFEGKFDEYGSYSANSTSVQYNLILPRIPKNFVARGFEDFSFKMNAIETEWEIHDTNHVQRMIGDPFQSSKSDRAKFIRNRENLLDMKAKFLKQLE